jgi:hypothetical protein
MNDHSGSNGTNVRPFARMLATTIPSQTVEAATGPDNVLFTKIDSDPLVDQFDL